jgi:hypothetical protein
MTFGFATRNHGNKCLNTSAAVMKNLNVYTDDQNPICGLYDWHLDGKFS